MLPLTTSQLPVTGTSLWRTDPFRSLRERMDRLFDETLARTEGSDILTGQWVPSVDVRENGDYILVEADLPGLDKKDVKVSVENGMLTITGERKLASETKNENYHRVERAYGSFCRSFALPTSVDEKRIAAVHKNGVLSVRLPKKEEAKAHRVEVKVEG